MSSKAADGKPRKEDSAMPGEATATEPGELLEACRDLRQVVSDLCEADPRDLGAAEARELTGRLRRLRSVVDRHLRDGAEAMPPELRENVLHLLQCIHDACRDAAADVEVSLEEMRAALSELTGELLRLRSYRRGTASRGAGQG